MTIDQRRYVDIASGVIGATAAAMQKLDLRIMTTNPLVPSGSVLEFTSALGVAEFFGAMSEEAGLASAYFAYVSPAPVSRARALQFAPHADSARDPSLIGAVPGTISEIQALGSSPVTLVLDGVSDTQTVDFSGLVA